MSRLRTPIVTVITGEGGSGGALAIAVGDVVIALENAVYSVISPEGCASILWRSPDEASTAAAAMRMSAADQHALGVVDIVVPEPGEGAHDDPGETARRLRAIILDRLAALEVLSTDALVESRYRRYRALGAYTEVAPTGAPERVDRSLADRLRGLLDPGRRPQSPGWRAGRATNHRPARRSDQQCPNRRHPMRSDRREATPSARRTTPRSIGSAPSSSRH